jgi:UDP-N-acetylmuramyl pentapeptide phosphotransferase/UDP-N-acetylglucosamine-1-phosphate transferase
MFLSILISLTLTLIIVLLPKNWVTDLDDLTGVQKFHHQPTPRIAGVPVFMSFFIGLWYLDLQEVDYVFLLLASLPVFMGGSIEDIIVRVSPFKRMISILASIVMMFVFLDIRIDFLGFTLVDYLLSNSIVSLLFTLLVVGGVVNAINIIDGYNGLLIGYSIAVLLAIAYVANILGDDLVIQLSLILIASLLGVFIFNFPFGKIFMGDGGAYFTGFMMAVIGLMLGNRNEEVSHWFVLLLFIYPLYETAFSIYRRKLLHKTDASQPDANHLHSLIYRKVIPYDRFKHRKVICNSMVAPVMWLLSLLGIIPAVIWFNNQAMLIIWAFVFMLVYTIFYKYIASDKLKFNH